MKKKLTIDEAKDLATTALVSTLSITHRGRGKLLTKSKELEATRELASAKELEATRELEDVNNDNDINPTIEKE